MQGAYYLKVDNCILKAWRRANEGDLSALRMPLGYDIPEKVKKKLESEQTAENDILAWEQIQDDFIRVIGIGERYKSFLDLLSKRANLQLQYLKSAVKRKLDDGSIIIIRDRKLLVRIEILTAKIKQYHVTAGHNIAMNRMLIKLGKMHGNFIRETEITVVDYHNLIEEYSNNG